MARKSNATAAKLCYTGHLLMEHRNALLVDIELTEATGYAERATALEMLETASTRNATAHGRGRQGLRHQRLRRRCPRSWGSRRTSRRTRHGNRSTIDGRTTRHAGHAVSQRIRKRIEEPFGWIKTIAGGRKLRYIGRQRNRAWFLMTGAVYNIIRITALDATPA